MSRWTDLKELIAPGSVRHTVAPPLEAGLRPNRRLQDASVRSRFAPLGVDDVVVWNGRAVVSAGRAVAALEGGEPATVWTSDAEVGALAVLPEGLAMAVEGRGIILLSGDGSTRVLSDEPRVRTRVTALHPHPDGGLLATVGSTRHDQWERALMLRDRSGLLLRIDIGGRVDELDTGIAWPAGVAVEADGAILLSVANDHVVERRAPSGAPATARTVLHNLPGYPGRLVAAGDGTWWAVMPRLRSRATELMFEFPDMVQEMVSSTEVDSWLVPRLRIEVPHRAPLQVGELSVLGQIKPWAPTRTYGLAFRFASSGQIVESAHSRADGDRHGATGVAVDDEGGVLVAVRGAGCIVEIGQEGVR
jgi:hypothetical protein